MLRVCKQAFCLRVSDVVLPPLLFVSRSRGSTCDESDYDVARGGPLPLLLVRFLCDKCNDVALCVGMHEINSESLTYCDVRRRMMDLKQFPCSCMSRWEYFYEDHLGPWQCRS